MKRKADPSWDHNKSDEFKSDGENKKFPPKQESGSDAPHPAVDLSKRRIVKLKLPSEMVNESVARAQPKATGSFQLSSNLSTTQPSSIPTEIKPAGTVSFLSSSTANQSNSNKQISTEASIIKPNLSLSAETLNSEPFKDTNQVKPNTLFGNITQNSDSNASKPSDSSNGASNIKSGLFANSGSKPDSAQKFGLFGRSTSGEKSPLASTPLVSGKTSTPDKPLEQPASQGGLFGNLVKTTSDTKPAAFTFNNNSNSNGSQPTANTSDKSEVPTPSIEEQPKLIRQDSTQQQLQRVDSKNVSEEKQIEAAAKKEQTENTPKDTKNINLFSTPNQFQLPGQKSGVSLFGSQPSTSQPFNLTPKPTEEKPEPKADEQSTQPNKSIFGGLLKQDEKKPEAEAPKTGSNLIGNSTVNGSKPSIFDAKPSGAGLFANILKNEPAAENKTEQKTEAPKVGIFANINTGGPLFGAKKEEKTETTPAKEEPKETPKVDLVNKAPSGSLFGKVDTTAPVAPLVTHSETKQKISLFGDSAKKEEPKPVEADNKPAGAGLFGKLFNGSGDLSQLAKKDYSSTKFDNSGEDTENAIKEAEKEKKEKEKAEKEQAKPKFNPWANLNVQPTSTPSTEPSKSGLFGSTNTGTGLFANLNSSRPNLFAKDGETATGTSSFLMPKPSAIEDEGSGDEDPEAEVGNFPTGGAPTLNKDGFKYEDTTDKLVAINVAKFKGPETALFTGGEISLNKPKDGKIYYLIYRDVSKLVRYQAQVFPNISKVEFFNPRQDSVTVSVIRQKEGKPIKEVVKAMFKDSDECKKFKDGFEKNLL